MIKKKRLIIYLAAFLQCGVGQSIHAQTINVTEKKQSVFYSKIVDWHLRPSYIATSFGFSSSSFIDFATSPLLYSGNVPRLAVSVLKKDDSRESELNLSYKFGSLGTNFNDNSTFSDIEIFDLFYSKLYAFPQLCHNTFNTKIGFQLQGTELIRYNSNLLNNSYGTEVFLNLMGSVKFTKDISRNQVTERKIWFLKYRLNEKKRDLALRTNVGLLNSTFRNGYIYGGQSHVLNDPKEYDGYKFSVFSGFRISSRLDYTRYLKNKNSVQFSYVWDAFQTGGDLDKIQMANHSLCLTLLFNTNNR